MPALPRLATIAAALTVCLGWAPAALGAPSALLLVRTSAPGSNVAERVALVAAFSGVELREIEVASTTPVLRAVLRAVTPDVGLVVIDAAALHLLPARELRAGLAARAAPPPSVMLAGVSADVAAADLRAWTDGAVATAFAVAAPLPAIHRVAASAPHRTGVLSGLTFESTAATHHALALPDGSPATVMVSIDVMGRPRPTFVELGTSPTIFVEAETAGAPLSQPISAGEYPLRFVEIAPLLVATRQAFGEYAWHTVGAYANLTIDDPLLVEPYGFLSYPALLAAMQTARFHTTIAFIPWNFDRSDEEVASLVRAHPAEWSIAVHGNNHDHREFDPYDRLPDGSWPPAPLKEQEDDVRQALARMQAFTGRTGIPHDRVMVFPHSIPGAMTLALLKQYDFWATVNLTNTPLGLDTRQPLSYFLRALSLQFENFPSLRRYPPGGLDASAVARELFLGNPVLLYAHHDYFREGSAQFDAVARTINAIEPAIRWRGLGDIVRRFYLERRVGNDYEIRAFSTATIIRNEHDRPARFLVRRSERSYPAVDAVLVNGRPQGFDRDGDDLVVGLSLAAGEEAEIVVRHVLARDLSTIPVEKAELRVRLLRLGAEARDRVFARSPAGQALIAVYYQPAGMALAAALAAATAGALIARAVVRSRKSEV